jgi:hypothetical protein
MDDLLKAIMMTAIADAAKKERKPSDVKKNDEVQEAKELAKMNKILFDAHIEAGFTAEQAIQIVAAQNN